jgi:hypothetical protein
LSARHPGARWEVAVEVEGVASWTGGDVDLVKVARERMLREGWELAICLTDLPVLVGRRPVTAHASVALRVGLVSVPALGVLNLETRVRDAVLRLVDRILRPTQRGRRARRRRLWPSPVGHAQRPDEETVRWVTGLGTGNLRLLVGMVRANRPWRLAAGLSRALVAALGTAAIALTSPGVWRLADGMGWGRLVGLSLASVLIICMTLVVVHGLWERSPDPRARQRLVLVNLTTALTIVIGFMTLYVALFLVTLVGGFALIPEGVVENELQHEVGIGEYVRLPWLASSLATLGGALGSAVETDQAVRAAAYGYHDDEDAD